MISIYLWINAALYLLFGVLCLARITATSNNLGYITLNAAGRSEYAVVYGGMQLGLSLFFAYAALPQNVALKAGLILAIALYVPIAILRWITILGFGVRARMTTGVGILETALAISALILQFSQH
jgi:hypothetical protein